MSAARETGRRAASTVATVTSMPRELRRNVTAPMRSVAGRTVTDAEATRVPPVAVAVTVPGPELAAGSERDRAAGLRTSVPSDAGVTLHVTFAEAAFPNESVSAAVNDDSPSGPDFARRRRHRDTRGRARDDRQLAVRPGVVAGAEAVSVALPARVSR